jgi:hypothetical protein
METLPASNALAFPIRPKSNPHQGDEDNHRFHKFPLSVVKRAAGD